MTDVLTYETIVECMLHEHKKLVKGGVDVAFDDLIKWAVLVRKTVLARRWDVDLHMTNTEPIINSLHDTLASLVCGSTVRDHPPHLASQFIRIVKPKISKELSNRDVPKSYSHFRLVRNGDLLTRIAHPFADSVTLSVETVVNGITIFIPIATADGSALAFDPPLIVPAHVQLAVKMHPKSRADTCYGPAHLHEIILDTDDRMAIDMDYLLPKLKVDDE